MRGTLTLTGFLLARIAEDEAIDRKPKVDREALVRMHNSVCVDPDCRTIAAMASVWSDHPDYREEWRP